MNIKAFYDEPTGTVSYIISDPKMATAAFIDPVLNYDAASATISTTSADAMLDFAKQQNFKVLWSLETHIHADHLTASDYIRSKTGAKIGVGEKVTEIQSVFQGFYHLNDLETDGSQFDVLFADGDHFQIGELDVRVMHTPGHTPACVSYLLNGAAFVGDTLFMPDFGTARTDFPGGDAKELYRSIRTILDLDEHTNIYVGHDYLSDNRQKPEWVSTVAQQSSDNIHVNSSIDEQAFIAMRQTRDVALKAPALILPSLQVNIRAGQLNPAESDGHHYLKIPINKLAS